MLQLVIIKYYHDKKQKTSKKLILPVGSLERISFIYINQSIPIRYKEKSWIFQEIIKPWVGF